MRTSTLTGTLQCNGRNSERVAKHPTVHGRDRAVAEGKPTVFILSAAITSSKVPIQGPGRPAPPFAPPSYPPASFVSPRSILHS